jgi:hypothetical protein
VGFGIPSPVRHISPKRLDLFFGIRPLRHSLPPGRDGFRRQSERHPSAGKIVTERAAAKSPVLRRRLSPLRRPVSCD